MQKDKPSLLILLVLYNQTLLESLSYKKFCEVKKHLILPYQLLVYNNTPSVKIPEDDSYIVINATENKMLSGAYNFALDMAITENYEWILLLDQDTNLQYNYFVELSQAIENVSSDVGAITPIIFSNDRQISPVVLNVYLGPFGYQKAYTTEHTILKSSEYISGINSATVIRTKAIKKIGGFSCDFPLDFLDHWYFYQFSKENYKIKLLKTKIEHNLSISRSYNPMGIKRYIQYMKARALYAHKTKFTVLLTFKARTLGQCIKQLFKKSERKFSIYTFRALFY